MWWAGMDSNHRTLSRTDLQSAAFSRSATYPYAKNGNLDTSNNYNNLFKIKIWWCAFKDSNLGPTGYEPVALTNWAKGASIISVAHFLLYFILKNVSRKFFIFLLFYINYFLSKKREPHALVCGSLFLVCSTSFL